MIQNNYFSENEDIQRQFKHIVDWKEIVEWYENGFGDAKLYAETKDEKYAYAPTSVEEAVEGYRTLLDAVGELVGAEVAPRSPEMDKIGLKFADGKVTFPEPMVAAYNAVREAGLQPYSITRKYGGLGVPAVVQATVMELLSRGDAALAIALGCVNLAETIERFGSKEMKEKWVPKMASGEVTGAMALTEPNYGSDLPGVQSRAVKGPDGVWRITGTKRFITHGCGFTNTPSVILTLARTGSPTSGARGLSFFLVEGKDVTIAGIEKKLGLHCSPTCEVVYENTPAEMIGQEGMGLVRYAMGMMNNARLSIASQSMGIATAAYYEARKYASERQQFGKLIQEIPAVRKMLDRMEREIIAMRALLMEAARSVDGYVWRLEHLEHAGKTEREIKNDEQIRFWEKLANLFTPLSKYYISEWCNTIASDALQVHGGAGYTEDYDVARIYRDARITNIYEGTTQLQIVACIGGVVSGMAATGNLRAYLDENMGKFTPSAALKEVRQGFEEAVKLFKDIKDGTAKDMLAFETVECAARCINGMLMERAASRLSGTDKEHVLVHAQAYHIDSLATIKGNLVRLQKAERPALAGV